MEGPGNGPPGEGTGVPSRLRGMVCRKGWPMWQEGQVQLGGSGRVGLEGGHHGGARRDWSCSDLSGVREGSQNKAQGSELPGST